MSGVIDKKTKKISDRNRLIKIWCEHQPRKNFITSLGKKKGGSGIYILYRKGKVYDIGQSKSSIRSRLRMHATKDRFKGKWDSFSFYQIKKKKYIKDVETLLQRIYIPKGNKKYIGRFRRKYHFKIKKR